MNFFPSVYYLIYVNKTIGMVNNLLIFYAEWNVIFKKSVRISIFLFVTAPDIGCSLPECYCFLSVTDQTAEAGLASR